ncbi:metallophosphoesterase family protein [Chloroflexota bacterium]
MLYAILGDIHSNLEAFRAVLKDLADKDGFDQIWCLGDVVGYGPDPCACIELLRRHAHICVAGNHDWASIERADISEFNLVAAYACLWTSKQLDSDDVDYLGNLPEVVSQGDFTIVHGSPRQPLWEYVLSASVANQNIDYFDTKYCLVGHSHVPLVYTYDEALHECKSIDISDGYSFKFAEQRLIINPGGVGQPRDGNPKASYMLYNSDAGTLSHHRIDYNFSKTQAKMTKHNLPDLLIERLAYGY